MSQLTEDNFLKDVASHEIQVIRDDELYRHIRLKKPGTMCMHFDLITWPGYLCYTGDMGTYVFTRLTDMFEFFRRSDKKYPIDKRYWAEKVEAADKSDGIKEFSSEKFKKNILSFIDDHEEANTPDDGASDDVKEKFQLAFDELREAVNDEVLSCDDNDVRAFDAANEFQHDGDAYLEYMGEKEKFYFQDFFEMDNTEYTHRFVWCCFALAWGIDKYDQFKQSTIEKAA